MTTTGVTSDFNASDLDSNFSNLDKDITAIDVKISELEQLILDMKNTINRTTAAVRQATNSDKGVLYKIINSTMEILSAFYQNYQRFMELKYRYRKEQDDLTLKSAHLIQIDLKKIDRATDASYLDVIEVLKKLSVSNTTEEKVVSDNIKSELDNLENDDKYSMT